MKEYREKREYILPVRILAAVNVSGGENLLQYHSDISSFLCQKPCIIHAGGYIVLDFGREYQGGVKLVVQDMCGEKNARVRIRFGESAMECCSDVGVKGATNDHSVRDEVLCIPWVGCLEYGMTGYRFIRIDNVDKVAVSFIQILGISVHSGKKMVGEFRCNDDRINEVWKASAYTVYLNNNKYITDGIKRDRLVWIGDMHPETISVLRLFGNDDSIRRSLDYIRNLTDPEEWMNAIPSYSMWWIKIHWDLYWYTGDLKYLKGQLGYLRLLCRHLVSLIHDDGRDDISFRFIDWPSSNQPEAQNLGIHALLTISLQAAMEIFRICDEDLAMQNEIKKALLKLSCRKAEHTTNKQAVALAVFAGLIPADIAEEQVLSKQLLSDLSTFLGYYVMQAHARAGKMQNALTIIRKYYGAMLDLGATTMWEDFDLRWIQGAKPIDSLLQNGEYDVHGDNGAYCYSGYRHSLCHGWAGGTAPFVSEFVLGIKVAQAGCKKIILKPSLGGLEWAEGVFPTPLGPLSVRIDKKGESAQIEYEAPKGIEVSLS